ncbi:LutB/LldF family L-lactate oxidation iron-sulfur protein [Fontivita pretiosa]|uniref:LutB/LldF family L-lactate oxidation iron-sulfur protein n=1 Tax=Fontivita pretiosa TaxID=2989684 RepID=UPI003D1786E5
MSQLAQQRSIDPATADFLQQAHQSPFDFHEISVRAAGDEKLHRALLNSVVRQYTARQLCMQDLPDAEALRTLAGQIKQHTLDHLDYYLEQLKANVQRNGGQVHFARDGAQARQIILQIARAAGCSRCIKSKSMVSEEIDLAQALEAEGMDVVETDLGEFIVQISHDRPSHIVAPIVHKDKASIARLFSEYFHTPYNEDPQTLTKQARQYLREKFRRADFGMTGGNFLIAETGQVCVVENEGNARQSTTTPRVLVSLVGIEKLIPRQVDLAVMLKLLARSATGQPMTVYTSLFGGPRRPGEKDGPEQFHLVLIDNGRSEILRSEYRETLRCIRCGACLNACPIYRTIGGHAYGSVYPGPIGALITPLFRGLGSFKDLPQASSLCGACYEVCPVKINIPRHLINLRRDIVAQRLNSAIERGIYRLWAWAVRSPLLYAWIGRVQKWDLRRRARRTGWVQSMPFAAAGWTQVRSMPAPAKKTFHQLWQKRRKG